MSSQDRIEIGKRLRLARENSGLTQSFVAKQLTVHRPTISEIEAGRRRVSGEELRILCDLYDVSAEWVIRDRSDAPDAAVELAARRLAGLKEEDLNTVLNLLKTLKANGGKDDNPH